MSSNEKIFTKYNSQIPAGKDAILKNGNRGRSNKNRLFTKGAECKPLYNLGCSQRKAKEKGVK